MSIYDFKINVKGKEDTLERYAGKPLIIVNTASKCGLKGQFEQLEELYQKYNGKINIIGFPSSNFAKQEYSNQTEIEEFCQINYGVTFDINKKVDVLGKNIDPLFEYLTNNTGSIFGKGIKWNFTKFLIDSEGNIVKRYSPEKNPLKIEEELKKLLKN
jgi:glutathione peroxidase